MSVDSSGHTETAQVSDTARPSNTVIIVEDEALIAFYLSDLLEEMGWTVCCVARSGADAMDLAGQMKPDVALMDIGLIGGMDGFQTAAELRSRYGIPSLLISGASNEKAERRAKEVSSMGILAKPFTPEALDEALRACLNRAGA